jgi:hypothetical protein
MRLNWLWGSGIVQVVFAGLLTYVLAMFLVVDVKAYKGLYILFIISWIFFAVFEAIVRLRISHHLVDKEKIS